MTNGEMRTILYNFLYKSWALSSVVERYVDIVEVVSSILTAPTNIHKIKLKIINMIEKI